MIPPGRLNLSAAQYHADPCLQPSLSNSIAKILLDQSPLHAWYAHPRLNPNYAATHDTKFDMGTAAHQLLLERRHDGIVVVDAADWRTKAAKEARDAAHANGQTTMLTYQYERARQMVAAAQQFIATTELNGILELGQPEQTFIWQEGPIWCRARTDLIWEKLNVILDYKTTECAQQDAFIRQIGRMSYDLQAEFYVRGASAQKPGVPPPTFVFLAQEVSPPYACSLVGLANSYRAVGQAKVTRALKLWCECMATNRWPQYSTQIAYAEPPSWQITEMEAVQSEQSEGEDE